MNVHNPYSAPGVPVEPIPWSEDDGTRTSPSAREVFLAWERLRVVYNGILIAETLLIGLLGIHGPGLIDKIPLGALGANLCFCAGPVFEGYLNLFGASRSFARRLVFVAGMLLAIALTLGVLIL